MAATKSAISKTIHGVELEILTIEKAASFLEMNIICLTIVKNWILEQLILLEGKEYTWHEKLSLRCSGNICWGRYAVHVSMLCCFWVENCEEASEEIWTPTEALYNAFTEQFGDICSKNVFSERLFLYARKIYPGISKSRNRITPGGNPVHGYRGIRLKGCENEVQENAGIV